MAQADLLECRALREYLRAVERRRRADHQHRWHPHPRYFINGYKNGARNDTFALQLVVYLADLFLGIPECNTNTHGCDTLWGGTPNGGDAEGLHDHTRGFCYAPPTG
ncbi:hypothetical protein F443_13457, partial [Phytophthora nicotianae P1569]